MSMLTEKLPEKITICGKVCAINTDFRVWLEFARIMSSRDNTEAKLAHAIIIVFSELPPKLQEAVTGMLEFFECGKKNTNKCEGGVKDKCLFDFEQDAPLIYSAFLQTYGIDLTTANMHWWRFRSLLTGLGEDTMFSKVVGYRAVNLSDIKDKERKAFYKRMKAIHKLDDNRTNEEREADMMAELEAVF